MKRGTGEGSAEEDRTSGGGMDMTAAVVDWLRRYLFERPWVPVDGARWALLADTGVYISSDHWVTLREGLR